MKVRTMVSAKTENLLAAEENARRIYPAAVFNRRQICDSALALFAAERDGDRLIDALVGRRAEGDCK